MGIKTWIAQKIWDKFQKENKEWWGNIEAQKDLINVRQAIRADRREEILDTLAKKLSESDGVKGFSRAMNEAAADPGGPADVDFDVTVAEFSEAFTNAYVDSIPTTRMRDKARLRIIEKMNPNSWTPTEKHDYIYDFDEGYGPDSYDPVSNPNAKPVAVSKVNKYEILADAMRLWERARKPYCKLMYGHEGCQLPTQDTIYK
jgi:hypothetical protein